MGIESVGPLMPSMMLKSEVGTVDVGPGIIITIYLMCLRALRWHFYLFCCYLVIMIIYKPLNFKGSAIMQVTPPRFQRKGAGYMKNVKAGWLT